MFSNCQGRVHCWGLNRLCHCCTCRYSAYCFILLSCFLVAFVAILLIVALAFVLITVTLAVCNLRCYFDITRIIEIFSVHSCCLWLLGHFFNSEYCFDSHSWFCLRFFFVLDVFWYIFLCFSQVNPYLNILKYPKFFSYFSAMKKIKLKLFC